MYQKVYKKVYQKCSKNVGTKCSKSVAMVLIKRLSINLYCICFPTPHLYFSKRVCLYLFDDKTYINHPHFKNFSHSLEPQSSSSLSLTTTYLLHILVTLFLYFFLHIVYTYQVCSIDPSKSLYVLFILTLFNFLALGSFCL